jgi:hypothetical protein
VDVGGHPTRASQLAQLGLVRCGISRQHEHGAALGGDPAQRPDQACQVLVRALGGHAEHERTAVEAAQPLGGRPGVARSAGRLAHALGHDVHPVPRGARVAEQVVAGRLARHDHAPRATHRERDEHAHAEATHAEVRIRLHAVMEIVHGHDPRERPGDRPCRREAVDDIDRRSASQPHGVELVARHPLASPARVDGRGGGLCKLTPLGARQAVHQQRQPEVVAPRERADELTRVDLQTAHLAGSEEEQVDPDVHGCRA